MSLAAKRIDTPVGELTLVACDTGLAAILWPNDAPARVPLAVRSEVDGHPILEQTASQLTEYFDGDRTRFSIPLRPSGTDFQRQVWEALLTIPFGETRSYQAIARQIGRPAACRAVGAANGRNPISIIAPCHRVIGATGKLTGFAGGLAAKQWLLRHETMARADAARSVTPYSQSILRSYHT